MQLQERNVITLCGWMRTELGLKGTDLLVYGVIYSYTQFSREQSYNDGQEFLAEWAGVDVRTVQRSIVRLILMGLVSASQTLFGNSIYKTIAKNAEKLCRDDKMSGRDDKMSGVSDDKMSPHNILNNNILNNSSSTNVRTCVCEKEGKELFIEWVKTSTLYEWTLKQLHKYNVDVFDNDLSTLLTEFYENDFTVAEKVERRERTDVLKHYQCWLPKYLKIQHDKTRSEFAPDKERQPVQPVRGVLPD